MNKIKNRYLNIKKYLFIVILTILNINIYAQEINNYNINEECIICDIDCSISLDELELNEKKEEEYKKIAHNIVKNSQKCNINIESNSNIYTPSQTTYQLKTIRDEIENHIKNNEIECACTGLDDELKVFITDINNEQKVKNVLRKLKIQKSAFKILTIQILQKNSSGKVLYSKLKTNE